jgi:hypothetical protein
MPESIARSLPIPSYFGTSSLLKSKQRREKENPNPKPTNVKAWIRI